MWTLKIVHLENGKWVDVEAPAALTEQINLLSECAGKDYIIKMETSRVTRYFAGTQAIFDMLEKKHKDADTEPFPMIATCEGAYNSIQYEPDLFFTTVEEFFGQKEVDKLLPKKGWGDGKTTD